MLIEYLELVIFNDGYEYEVERDDQTLFSRVAKKNRGRQSDQGKATKRRKIDPIEHHFLQLDKDDSEYYSESTSEDEEGYVCDQKRRHVINGSRTK